MHTSFPAKLSTVFAACVTAGLISTPSLAATVSGVVKDTGGKPLSGIEVRLEGKRLTATTDAQGRYVFENVDPAHVHIHVASPDYIHEDVELGAIANNQTQNFTLTPSSIDNVVVYANAIESSVLESVTPVSVIGADTLRKQQQVSLGESLKNTPGVHSTYFGPVASSPIIRGNDGPRVKIVQNSLDVTDVSRVGADHNVTAHSSTATQIEVLRGPATLQYGSGAIGGVVNVVDNRIAREQLDGVEGEAEVRATTVDDGEFAKVDLNIGNGSLVGYFDFTSLETENADIPGFASLEPDDDEPEGILENSTTDMTRWVAGLSYVGDRGYVGFAVEELENAYGVPGHGHAHEEEEEHDDEHEDEDEHGEEEEGVLLDVDMTRYQFDSELYSPFKGFSKLKLSAAYTDYEHVELEGEEIGTTFTNEGLETRLSLHHENIAGWHGVIGLQYAQSDYEALGEEAFSPPTDTDSFALFVVEQKKVDNFTYELGARLERTSYQADPIDIELGELEHLDEGHDDDDDHDDEGHDDEHGDEHEDVQSFAFDELSFTSVSLSAGVNWEYESGHFVGASISRNERAPSHQELFSGGPHLATETFELGLVFDLHDGELEDELRDVSEEVSTNLDLTFRKVTGSWGYTVSLFYSDVADYIYLQNTGFVQGEHEDEHGDEEEHEGEDEHGDEDEHGHDEEGLPVFNFNQEDATLYGFEAEVHTNLEGNWQVMAFADYIRAELDNENLARIPPLRVGGELHYDNGSWSGEFGFVWYDDQTDIAPFETATDGYTLVNAGVRYEWMAANVNWVAFLEGQNLTDQKARVHSSFIKDQAPLPGRNFALGIRAHF